MSWKKPKAYAVRHIDNNVVNNSRSGGVFTALTDYVLENEGVIYGSVLNKVYSAKHIRASDVEKRNLMRGSKYIQSSMGNTYLDVKQDLLSGNLVLFSGTSCQIDGLRKFLGKDFDNLISVDIVCHGVPSKKVWSRYLEWQEKREKGKIVKVDFRNKKKFGWRAHFESLVFEDGHQIDSNVYAKLFYDHTILRPSCYECPYKKIMHPGDITIADFWGIETAVPKYDDDKGVSLVMINNDRGNKFFQLIDNVEVFSVEIEKCLQPPLIAPFPKPKIKRKLFWHDFKTKSFDYIVKKYTWVRHLSKLRTIISRKRG